MLKKDEDKKNYLVDEKCTSALLPHHKEFKIFFCNIGLYLTSFIFHFKSQNHKNYCIVTIQKLRYLR